MVQAPKNISKKECHVSSRRKSIWRQSRRIKVLVDNSNRSNYITGTAKSVLGVFSLDMLTQEQPFVIYSMLADHLERPGLMNQLPNAR